MFGTKIDILWRERAQPFSIELFMTKKVTRKIVEAYATKQKMRGDIHMEPYYLIHVILMSELEAFTDLYTYLDLLGFPKLLIYCSMLEENIGSLFYYETMIYHPDYEISLAVSLSLAFMTY